MSRAVAMSIMLVGPLASISRSTWIRVYSSDSAARRLASLTSCMMASIRDSMSDLLASIATPLPSL